MIDALTGLRFLAAMMVVFHHHPIPGASGPLATVMRAGYSGVTLFFVLSGFVLTHNYLRAFRENPVRALWPFLVARVARVYPLYALVLIYMWLAAGANVDIVPYLFTAQVWSDSFWTAFGIVGPGWSIGVEFFLYSCFPALIVCFHRAGIFDRTARLIALGVATVVVMTALALYFDLSGRGALSPYDPASAHHWLYRMPVTRLGDFILGILAAAFCVRHREQMNRHGRVFAWLAGTSGILILLLMGTASNVGTAYSWDVLYALPSALLILGLAGSDRGLLARLLATRTFVVLGEISFCLYLLHVPLRALKQTEPLGLPAQLIHYAIFIFLLVAISYGLHRLFEKPMQAWIRDQFSRRSEPAANLKPG